LIILEAGFDKKSVVKQINEMNFNTSNIHILVASKDFMETYFKEPEVTIDYEYTVFYNCQLMTPRMQQQKLLILIYFGITLYWVYLQACKHSRTRTMFHKILCSLPILKALYLMTNYYYESKCPWENELDDIYANLFKIIFSLLHASLQTGCIILACIGFKIVRKDVTRL